MSVDEGSGVMTGFRRTAALKKSGYCPSTAGIRLVSYVRNDQRGSLSVIWTDEGEGERTMSGDEPAMTSALNELLPGTLYGHADLEEILDRRHYIVYI